MDYKDGCLHKRKLKETRQRLGRVIMTPLVNLHQLI